MIYVTGDGVVQETRRPKISWWQVLRVVLAAGWVVSAGLAWWAAPREASAADARADLAGGHVRSYEWGDDWESDNSPSNPFGVRLRTSGGAGPIFLWRTGDGRTHYVVLDGGTTTEQPPAAGLGPEYSGPEARALDVVVQADLDRITPADRPAQALLAGLGIAGVILILWALVSAPAGAIGTKWFWFWVITGMPFGLGLLWWLARERPWSSSARPRETPLRWYAGIGAAILGGLLAGVAVLGLRHLLGDAVIPDPH